jgi:hypothetical protein
MRAHPISPVTEPLQYRAIGVVRGHYIPTDASQPTRGVIRTATGTELEAVVLGRLLTLMRRHLDLELPHLWVVYPRSRDENKLHLQLVGVWEPSTLNAAAQPATARPAAESGPDQPPEPATAAAIADGALVDSGTGLAPAPSDALAANDALPEADALPEGDAWAEGDALPEGDALAEGDDYFSVRGELIYTRPETGDLVVKVRQLPRADGSRPVPFKLQLRGTVPLEHLRHFVSLDLRRQDQQLCVEAFEVVAPLAQRGTRGGKARRTGGSPTTGSTAGPERRGGERRPAEAEKGRSVAAPLGSHGRAVSRPSR